METETGAPEGVVVGLPGPAGAAAEPIDASLPLKRVLLVDDDADYREALRALLMKAGYDVFPAEDGVRALDLAREAHPHVVITDFNMPRLNGYEFIQALRAGLGFATTPIIVFTGVANRAQLAGVDLGCGRFLQKPFSNETLLRAVYDYIGTGHSPATGDSAAGPALPAAARPAPPAAPPPSSRPVEITTIVPDESSDAEEEDESALDDRSDSPLIAEVNRLLASAIDAGASDVHFEPGPHEVVVRFRIDGGLRKVAVFPASARRRLSTRLKIMANLVITERRLPQDGQINASIRGSKMEFRVSTMPGRHGEKVVLRLLAMDALKPGLRELGLSEQEALRVQRAVQSSCGLILATGPTGSGKSTTLYTLLKLLNAPDVNIMTAEDPVEYELPGIHQVAAKPAIGLTFERILRGFMRQDPDIMLVGEIRDPETADIAVKAAITGHLVVSTLHTNSAPATIGRLTQMGVPGYQVAASVRLVIAQRLVRAICTGCKKEVEPSEEQRLLLGPLHAERLRRVFQGAGCPQCHGTGYRGRMPLFEVMSVQSALVRQAVLDGAPSETLAQIGAKEGMVRLGERALQAVTEGATSLIEAMPFLMGDML